MVEIQKVVFDLLIKTDFFILENFFNVPIALSVLSDIIHLELEIAFLMEEVEVKDIKVGELVFQLDLSQPLYEQVIEQVRSAIARERIQLGEKIPSVRELAQALQINPNTVMRAYQELDRDGLIETRRGQGTFITTSREKVERIRENLAERLMEEFIERLESLGLGWNDVEKWIRKREKELSNDGGGLEE